MDVIAAITTRRSCRAFKPDPVPEEILKKVMEVSLRVPSSSNTQPWSFVVVGGKQMAALKQALAEKTRAGEPLAADFALPAPEGIYRERRRTFMAQMYGSLGIERDDEAKKLQWWQTMSRFFDAPNGIIVCLEKSLTPWALVDAGMVMQTIMLAAHGYGLGTCAMYRLVVYPEVLRQMFSIPESTAIVCGLAIGYPDMAAPVNRFRTARDPLDTFVSWHGTA